MKIRIEGPYYGSYSLARVNRELAIALATLPDTSVFISATAAESWHREHSDEQELADFGIAYIDVREAFEPDIVLRHTWPVESTHLKGRIKLRLFPWEETRIPHYIIDQFNSFYSAILSPSDFVQKVLSDCGVKLPIYLLENSTAINRPTYSHRQDNPQFCKFLHFSSCFPRKAVDVLIDAFVSEFSADDPVSLTIKTFHNPHVTVRENLAKARESKRFNAPRVDILFEDVDDHTLLELIDGHHFLTMPSRGEGFGLPVLEAHVRNKPCIMPRSTALAERFINGIDFAVDFEPALAQSHLAELGSIWFEPSTNSLKSQLRSAADMYLTRNAEYIDRTNRLNEIQFKKWIDVARDLIDIISVISDDYSDHKIDPTLRRRLVIISSFAQVCGIATYVENILKFVGNDEFCEVLILAPNIPTEQQRNPEFDLKSITVRRCWTYWGNVCQEIEQIYDPLPGDFVIVQHHTGFFSPKQLSRLVNWLVISGTFGCVTLHSVLDNAFSIDQGSYRDFVDACPNEFRILVHSLSEFKSLPTGNVVLFPHPFQEHLGYSSYRPSGGSSIVASFGFMRRHKGFRDLIEAWPDVVKHIPEAKLILLAAAHPAPDSEEELRHCRELIRRFDLIDSVTIISDFLADEEIQAILGYADAVMFAYKENNEGASGAIRIAFSSHSAIYATQIPLFAEFGDHIGILPSDHTGMASTIVEAIGNRERGEELRLAAARLVSRNSFKEAWKWLASFASVAERRTAGVYARPTPLIRSVK